MRKILFLALALCIAGGAKAQLEVKVNPIGLLFGNFNVLAETGLTENFGLEGQIGFASRDDDLGLTNYEWSAFNIGAAGKYYFNPREGFDRFYVGGYLRFNTGSWSEESGDGDFSSTRLSLGVLFGQKWVGQNGLVFELGAGAGRAIVNTIDGDDLDGLLFDIDILLRIAIGYRFGM
ncbi:MAG: DUF3575 domain-containing protein [Bacteroidota bacterium]